jgi:hypothetical protein
MGARNETAGRRSLACRQKFQEREIGSGKQID